MIDQELLFQLVNLLIAALVAVVVPYIRRYLLARVSAEQLTMGAEVARIVVRAVEQTIKATHGQDKLAEAIRRARVYAGAIGLNFTDEQWKHLIEQAVLDMNREWNTSLTVGEMQVTVPEAATAEAFVDTLSRTRPTA